MRGCVAVAAAVGVARDRKLGATARELAISHDLGRETAWVPQPAHQTPSARHDACSTAAAYQAVRPARCIVATRRMHTQTHRFPQRLHSTPRLPTALPQHPPFPTALPQQPTSPPTRSLHIRREAFIPQRPEGSFHSGQQSERRLSEPSPKFCMQHDHARIEAPMHRRRAIYTTKHRTRPARRPLARWHARHGAYRPAG